jgi:hypothetical protein
MASYVRIVMMVRVAENVTGLVIILTNGIVCAGLFLRGEEHLGIGKGRLR